MAKSSPAFQAKDRINHSVFGTGTIDQADSHYVVIVFDESGTRKFVADMVKLEPSDTPAPKRPIRRKKATTKATKKATTKATKKTTTKATKKVTKKASAKKAKADA